MKNKPPESATCPIGISDCEWLEQLELSRAEVAQLKTESLTDSLTGLYNYRHFESMLQSELQRSQRSHRPTSLIIVDLDFFKRVNDQYGHEAGNSALVATADILRASLRSFDIICRYGGEEFAIILPHTALHLAVQVAERVRASIEAAEVEFGDLRFTITASLGVNFFQPDDRLEPRQFMDQTDRFLYQAKTQGRNRVCHPDVEDIAASTEVSSDEKAALFGGPEAND